MKSPFVFHKVVTGDKFIGRERETKKLLNNFRDGINTFIISPRRTGKTSLVSHASQLYLKRKGSTNKTVFVFINLWNIRTEQEFYGLFTNHVLNAASSRFEEIIDITKKFLSNVKPTIDLEYESVKISFGFNTPQKDLGAILDLPQKIAERKKIQMIICMDEFQDIENFSDSISFQKKLRSHWQNHTNTSYILYGSKRHMLSNLFNDLSMPFYRFGDVLYLKKIELDKLVNFIVESFEKTQKTIHREEAVLITRSLDQHPYYIQQYCNILWQNTEKYVTRDMMNFSMNEFLEYNAGQFELILKNLSTSQLNFLKALSDGVVSFHAADILQHYQLGSSANVTSIKKALSDREIIDHIDGRYCFSDPAFDIYMRVKYNEERSDDIINLLSEER